MLIRARAGLNSVFSIKGKRHVRLTQALAAVSSGAAQVARSLEDQRETVLRALDDSYVGA